jgi:hypothetical protein
MVGTCHWPSDREQEMSFLDFFQQLGESEWSVAIHESEYGYPILESFHVWGMCFFFGMTSLFDLRLLGWTMRGVPVSEVIRRLLPWTVAGFIFMVITGTLLFYAIPVRSYQNLFFRTKMLLMAVAGINVLLFHSRVFPGVAKWDTDAIPPKVARIAGGLSLALWMGIIFNGRLIAYNWFDCDRQPQWAIINFLTSCYPTE